MDECVLKEIALSFLLPPTAFLTACGLGLLLRFRSRGLGNALVLLGLAGLLVASLPATSKLLLALLQRDIRLAPPDDQPPGAIIVLAGDQSHDSLAPLSYDVGVLSLERERAAAALARRTGLPVLISGGVLGDAPAAISDVMARSMATDFAVHARWTETASSTTWDGAEDSAAILRAAGIHSAYVVTQGWHIRRSLIAFRHAGFDVTAAPAGLAPFPGIDIDDFFPEPRSWLDTYYALHEWVGCAVYALRG